MKILVFVLTIAEAKNVAGIDEPSCSCKCIMYSFFFLLFRQQLFQKAKRVSSPATGYENQLG